MATLIVGDITPRNQYTASSGQTAFTYSFPIFADSDLKVYIGDSLKTLTTDYTVSDAGTSSGGTVTLGNGASTGDIVTIYRDVPVSRTSDYQTGGDFLAETLNDDLDKLTMMVQQQEDRIDNNTIRFSQFTDGAPNELTESATTRANKALIFNSSGEPIISSDDYTDQLGNVTTQASNASSSATAASNSANSATTQASTATTKASEASTSEANALTYKTAAQTAKTAAELAETNAETAETNAETAETNAETAETNAESSESNASASATAAASSASSIVGSVTAAAASATAAQSSEDDAATDLGLTNADVVLTHADVVSTHADVVLTAADVVLTASDVVSAEADKVQTGLDRVATAADVVSAETAKTAAETAKTASETAETSAESSETAAESAETNASSSASAASASAVASAASAASSAATYDNFDDRYLGAKSSDPTLDNDSNALIVGALYYNSTDAQLKVYTSNGWVDANSATIGTMEKFKYTATAGQTTFSGVDDGGVDSLSINVGIELVTLNGIFLEAGTDYTPSTTSIVLPTGAAVNDELNVYAFGNFEVANHYNQTQSDARYAALAGLATQEFSTKTITASSNTTIAASTQYVTSAVAFKQNTLVNIADATTANGYGTRTVSTSAPSGGSNGDVHYQV